MFSWYVRQEMEATDEIGCFAEVLENTKVDGGCAQNLQNDTPIFVVNRRNICFN